MSLSSGKVVKVINRVRDARGAPVPYDAHVDGDCITIQDDVWLPEGLARIAVQGSMYSIDPISSAAQYRLGVAEWGIPINPLSLQEVERPELIEREALTPDRQLGYKNSAGKTLKPVRINNPIRRHDPISQNMPGPRQDGALPGGYGEHV
jgi:hypothetical protein